MVLQQLPPQALYFNCIHFHQMLMSLVGLCNFWDVAKTSTVYFCSWISCEVVSQLFCCCCSFSSYSWCILTFRELQFNPNPSNWRNLAAKELKSKYYMWRLVRRIRSVAIESFRLNKGLITCLCDKYPNAKFHNRDLKMGLFMYYLSFCFKVAL